MDKGGGRRPDGRDSTPPGSRRPDPTETVEDEPGEYDALDEASMESFPASDPPAIPSRDGEPADLPPPDGRGESPPG